MATRTAPRRRRVRLSRPQILGSALALVDQDGLEALTMRRLAERLDIDPMSVYNYFDSKDTLLDGLAEALWREVQVPAGEIGWQETFRTLATSVRDLAHRHPHAYGLLLGRGILPAPALDAIDAALRALERAGLERERAAEMIRTLLAYAAGCAMLELSCAPVAGGSDLEQVVRITQALPLDTPVQLVEVGRLMAVCDMEYQFGLGLDLIIRGLEARL